MSGIEAGRQGAGARRGPDRTCRRLLGAAARRGAGRACRTSPTSSASARSTWARPRSSSIRDDPVGAADRALGGKADIVFECVGMPGLIAQAVEQVRGRGTILLLGLCTRPDTFNSFAMLSKEVRLVTSAFFKRGEYRGGARRARRRRGRAAAAGDRHDRARRGAEGVRGLKHRTHQCKVLIDPTV